MRQQCELLCSAAGTGDTSLSTGDFLKGERIQGEKGDSLRPVSTQASSKYTKPKKAIKLNEMLSLNQGPTSAKDPEGLGGRLGTPLFGTKQMVP